MWDFVSYNEALRVVEYSAIPPFRFSTTPPFYHSIEWRHPVELNVSYFGPCSLRKVSGSSEQLLLIKMVRWSIFKWIKFFFKVSTMYRSNLFTFSARKKSLFQLRAGDATVKLFSRCLSSIVMSELVRTEKKLYLRIYWE